MADTRTVQAGTGRAGVFYGWKLVAAFSVTQTVGYGALFYSFAVILTPMRAELGLSTVAVSGAMTVALLVGGVASVPIGGLLDRYGGRAIMTGGSIAGTALLVAWSQVDNTVQLYLVFAGIGLVFALVLYDPAFAVVVHWFRRRRATALLTITIAAGFASTIFVPLTGWLTDHHGWRHAVLALAVVHGLTTVPLHFTIRRPADLGLHADGELQPTGSDATPPDRAAIRSRSLRDRFYWMLVIGLSAHALTATILGVHLVAYLIHLGHPAGFAAAVTGLIGILSVTGRLVTTAISRRASLTTVSAAIFAVQAAAVLALPAIGKEDLGAIACVVGIGLGFGIASIIKPALLAARYGTEVFGSMSGLMALPTNIAKSLGPFAAAAILAVTGSYTSVVSLTAAALAVAALTTYAAGRSVPPSGERP